MHIKLYGRDAQAFADSVDNNSGIYTAKILVTINNVEGHTVTELHFKIPTTKKIMHVEATR